VKIKSKETPGFEAVEQLRPMIAAYCRRRGSRDPEGITAEVIAIAWAQREDLNLKHCRAWLITTARNLLFDEYRARSRTFPVDPATITKFDSRREPDFEIESLDSELSHALQSLSPKDREAVLLIAWEELTPAEASRSLGLSSTAFRVRLHRARHRLRRSLEQSATSLEARVSQVEEPI
jgi:RNA polymerase sigma-70 factor (ECF subfamily)